MSLLFRSKGHNVKSQQQSEILKIIPMILQFSLHLSMEPVNQLTNKIGCCRVRHRRMHPAGGSFFGILTVSPTHIETHTQAVVHDRALRLREAPPEYARTCAQNSADVSDGHLSKQTSTADSCALGRGETKREFGVADDESGMGSWDASRAEVFMFFYHDGGVFSEPLGDAVYREYIRTFPSVVLASLDFANDAVGRRRTE